MPDDSHQSFSPREIKPWTRIPWVLVLSIAILAVAGISRLVGASNSAAATRANGESTTRTVHNGPVPESVAPSTPHSAALTSAARRARLAAAKASDSIEYSDLPATATLRIVERRDRDGKNISGNNQIGYIGMRLQGALDIRVVTDGDIPVRNVPVYYILVSPETPSGSTRSASSTIEAFPPSPLVSDTEGVASLSDVTLSALGQYRIIFYLNPSNPTEGPMSTLYVEGRPVSWVNWMIISLSAGLAIFLLGAKVMSEGLSRLAGARLRDWLSSIGQHPTAGVAAGAGMTFLTQSSTASTTMLVTLTQANTLTLRQALPLIYGSAIGTTFTVQLLAFDIYNFALLVIVIGTCLQLFAKGRRLFIDWSTSILGFGLLFHGMGMMIQSIGPVRKLQILADVLHSLQEHAGWALLISMVLTALLHNSAATLGVVLALASQDLVSPRAAVPILFGANIGTTATALFAAYGLGREAKRVALAHLLFKAIGVVIFLPLMDPLTSACVWVTEYLTGAHAPLTGQYAARCVANMHTIFNIVITLIALPLTGRLEALVVKLVPGSEGPGQEHLKYIEILPIDNHAVLVGSARRELSRMGRFVEEQMRAIHDAIFLRTESKLDFIHRRDDKVDGLQKQLVRYLTDTMRKMDSPEKSKPFMDLLQIVNDIENIGDLIDKNLTPLGSKLILNKLKLHPEGEKEIQEFYKRVAEDLSAIMVAVASGDQETARLVRSHRQAMAEHGQKMLLRHLHRLQTGGPEALETSSVHTDLINYLERIEYHIYRIACVASGDSASSSKSHHEQH